MTGKIIYNKEVICVENAIDYVKKQGYLVIKPRSVQQIAYSLIFLCTINLFIASVLICK